MGAENAQKNYDFSLELDGIIVAHLQGVTVPTVEYAEHKHGTPGNSPDKKSAGKKLVGDLVVESVIESLTGDPVIWARFQSVRTGLRAVYAGQGFLIENGPGGLPIGRWFLKDVWLKKVESSNYDSRGDNSADVMRTTTWSVEDFERI